MQLITSRNIPHNHMIIKLNISYITTFLYINWFWKVIVTSKACILCFMPKLEKKFTIISLSFSHWILYNSWWLWNKGLFELWNVYLYLENLYIHVDINAMWIFLLLLQCDPRYPGWHPCRHTPLELLHRPSTQNSLHGRLQSSP